MRHRYTTPNEGRPVVHRSSGFRCYRGGEHSCVSSYGSAHRDDRRSDELSCPGQAPRRPWVRPAPAGHWTKSDWRRTGSSRPRTVMSRHPGERARPEKRYRGGESCVRRAGPSPAVPERILSRTVTSIPHSALPVTECEVRGWGRWTRRPPRGERRSVRAERGRLWPAPLARRQPSSSTFLTATRLMGAASTAPRAASPPTDHRMATPGRRCRAPPRGRTVHPMRRAGPGAARDGGSRPATPLLTT